MAEEPDNIVLEHLRNMRAQLNRIEERVDHLGHDMHDVKTRLTNVEEGMVTLNRRFDRLDVRMDRVERRLDLVSDETAG